MIKKSIPLILIINLLWAQDALGADDGNDVLNDILDALTDDHDEAYLASPSLTKPDSMLKSLNGSHETGITLSDYWIGSQAYSTDKSSEGITIAKAAVDAMVSNIHEQPVSNRDDDFNFDKAKEAFKNNPDLIDVGNLNTKADNLFGTSLQKARNIFIRAYQLKYLTESCVASWPDDENKPQRPGLPPARRIGTAAQKDSSKITKALNSPTACNYVTCNSRDTRSSFNGYANIKTAAEKLSADIMALNCSGKGTICESLKQFKLAALSSQPDGSDAEMIRLSSSLLQLAPIAQAFLLKEAQRKNIFPLSPGISSIYDKTIGPKNCSPQNASSPCVTTPEGASFTDGFVKTLTGITSIAPPIKPILPKLLYVKPNVGTVISVALAGQFVEFVPVPKKDYYQSSQTISSEKLFISKDKIQKLINAHDQNRMLYNISRDSRITKTMENLITKSASVEIIKELESMNSNTIDSDGTVFEKLFNTSTMRLKQEWTDKIGTYSNNSLLREIAVLLAEMNHKQYLDLIYKQKMILLLAVNSSKTEPQKMDQHSKKAEESHFLGVEENDPTADFDAKNVSSATGITSEKITDAADRNNEGAYG